VNSSPGDLYYKNVKGSSSDKRKIIPDGNLDLYKRIKNARNGKHVNKSKRCFFLGAWVAQSLSVCLQLRS